MAGVLAVKIDEPEPHQHEGIEQIGDLAEELAFELAGDPEHHQRLDGPTRRDPLAGKDQRNRHGQEERRQRGERQQQFAVEQPANEEVVDVRRVEGGQPEADHRHPLARDRRLSP